MLIKSKLTRQEFINVHFVVTYSKNSMKMLNVIASVFLLAGLMSYSRFAQPFSVVLVPFVMLAVTPVMTYYRASSAYGPNNRLCESLEYDFEENDVSIKGESFSMQLSWNKIYKVAKTKNWILIWQSNRIANPIPMHDFPDGSIQALKEIIMRQNVNNNL